MGLVLVTVSQRKCAKIVRTRGSPGLAYPAWLVTNRAMLAHWLGGPPPCLSLGEIDRSLKTLVHNNYQKKRKEREREDREREREKEKRARKKDKRESLRLRPLMS